MKIRYLVLLWVVLASSPVRADVMSIVKMFDYELGLSVRAAEMRVVDKFTSEELGYFSNAPGTYHLYFKIHSKYNYFRDGPFGYNVTGNFAPFRFDRQLVDQLPINLGTSVAGTYAYASPVLFYDFFARREGPQRDSSLRLGLGFGVGALKFTGDMILTEVENPRKVEFDTFSISYSIAVLLEYVSGPIVLRIAAGGPAIPGDTHLLIMMESAFDFGYVVRF